MNEGLIKDAYEAIAKEIQLILSMAYLLMVGIGMLFNHHKYAQFDINIFQYADVFDFLIAPFEDWNIMAFSLAYTLIPIILYFLDVAIQRKFPNTYARMVFGWDKKSWYNAFRVITFGLLLVFYAVIAAELYSKNGKKSILASEPISIYFADDTSLEGREIGKTADVIFLALPDEEVRIVPYTSLVKWIEP